MDGRPAAFASGVQGMKAKVFLAIARTSGSIRRTGSRCARAMISCSFASAPLGWSSP